MYPHPTQHPDDSHAEMQLNSELQHAQLELLSAHCAAYQLRTHYSPDDLARFGRRDILRKLAEAASALHDFYSAIANRIPQAVPNPEALQPTHDQILMAADWISSYLEQQRDLYLPSAAALENAQKAQFWPYFSADLLDRVRFIQLCGERVAVPEFFSEARARGFEPPEISHMDSLTFLDVIVFNESFSERALFHALVHTVQIQLLGVERYAELWVRSFVRTRQHFTVPLEVHAFSLTSRFLRPTPERFSVEDEVRLWIDNDRY